VVIWIVIAVVIIVVAVAIRGYQRVNVQRHASVYVAVSFIVS